MGAIEKIYNRYDYLTIQYANKLWNNTDLAIEKKDLIQELRIRLFMSIQTYLQKWWDYRNSNGVRPVPLEFYLKTVMVNKSRDLIGELSSQQLKLSIEDSGFQMGTDSKNIEFDVSQIIIGGQNILDLFHGKEKTLMKIHLVHNFDLEKTISFYSNKNKKREGEAIIERAMAKIRNFLSDDYEEVREFSYYEIQN